MIPVTQLKVGRTFKFNDEPYQALEYKHTKMGRGNASIRVKARNLNDGSIVEKTFVSGARIEPLETEVKSLQYLYRDEENCYFMDTRTFEQFSLPTKIFGPKTEFLREGKEVKIFFCEEQALSFELPNSMVFEVVKAPPGVKGDTVSGATKPITLDNGLVIRAPLFIKEGDKVKVDTRTGEYIGRVKQKLT